MIDPRQPNFASTPVSASRARFLYAPSPLEQDTHRVVPTVTVVTPYYNTGAIFHETAACLLGGRGLLEIAGRGAFEGDVGAWEHAVGQSLQNFEWVIVNDCSTDEGALRALDVYRRLAERDRRIRVVDHVGNHGLPGARNTGWRAARGEFVFFLDADDLIEPTTLEKSVLHLACNPEFAFVKGFSVGFGAQEYLWSRGFHSGAAMLQENLVTATTMVRRAVLQSVGGFDESIRRGMEDWEFWLRAAARGHWGETIPEHLDWYRRRDNQHAAWDNIASEEKRTRFLAQIRQAHGHIFDGSFPFPSRAWPMPFAYPPGRLKDVGVRMSEVAESSECEHDLPQNPLVKRSNRLLMVLPWLRMGGADRFNLDLVRFLTTRAGDGGWEVTIATTLPGHPWLPEFTALTPDVFPLDHLARPIHYARVLDHLIASRRPDVVMVSNSQLGYFLVPYLRSRHPETAFVDFNHMEEPHWQNGGHPRTGAGFQDQLDLSIVVSGHLRRWMCAPPRRAEAARIEVCHINADSTTFRPDPEGRAEWRAELDIDDDTAVILYAARLCPQKQPMVFARTMEMMCEARGRNVNQSLGPRRPENGPVGPCHGGKFVALVAGDGENYGELERFIAERGLYPRVRMLGSIPAARMPSLMAAADIFFLPSQWEGIALSIYEAMAAGLCVVGADVGGQAELVTPETGVLLKFPQRDAELEATAYVRTLEELIGNPGRVRSIGAAARRRIQAEFELDAMGARMLANFAKAQRLSREWPRQRISEGFARELAVQGVEMMRVQELAEELWPFRQRYLDLAASMGRRAEDEPSSTEPEGEAAARRELEQLESSRAWRTIQAAKSTVPYRLLARARFGAGWELVDPKEPAAVRLARLRQSRAFRLTQALQRLSKG